MKKIIKVSIIAVASLAVLASLVGNIYYFGWLRIQNYYMQQGYNLALAQVRQSILMAKEAQISDDMIVVKKPEIVVPGVDVKK